MSVQQPAWLRKSRPCPFFSQGRCLFADSCNFLHDVKVRNAVHQPILGTNPVKQPSPSPPPVPDPPSVVVNSASPRSADLASPQSSGSPTQDSSRYSGLLSVLSDVIGPPPTTAKGAILAFETIPTIPRSPAEMETVQRKSTHAESFPLLERDPEATLVDPCGEQGVSCFPGTDFATLFPVPGEEAPPGIDSAFYHGDGPNTYVIGSREDDIDECREEDSTLVLSSRQSTLSSFTGASLLASPRPSIFASPFSSPTGSGASDLLSPVEMSAKLRPFSVPSLGSVIERGGSMDSGHADGDKWVSPVPFPRSPPRGFPSSATFPSHGRRASFSSPPHEDRKAFRPPSHNPIEVINEVEADGRLEDNEATALAILGAHGASLGEGLGEGRAYGPLQVNIAEEKAKGDDQSSWVPGPRRDSPEHLHSTTEHDLDPCNQPSFISDDTVSFKTALSTQPSYENMSDTSRVSPVKQDSLLSYLSGCSTPDTSVLSHYGDTDEFLDQFIAGAYTCDPSHPAAQIDDPASSLEERPLPEEAAANSNLPHTLDGASDLQGLVPEKVVSPRGSLFDVLQFDRCGPISSPSTDSSHDLSLARDFLGHVPLTPLEGDIRGCSPGHDIQEAVPTHGYAAAEACQRLVVGNTLDLDAIPEFIDSQVDSFTQRLSFPLHPVLTTEDVGNSTLRGEDAPLFSKATVTNIHEEASNAYAGMLDVGMASIHYSALDLTEKARPSQLPLVEEPDSYIDFTLRRRRAASDLTVKGNSPPAGPLANTRFPRSPPSPVEQLGLSDSVQSLYDQYFDDDASDRPLKSSGPAYKGAAPPDPSSLPAEAEDHLQSPDLTLPISPSRYGSGTDYPRSSSIYQPLLTGRGSFSRSSLAELVPKPNPDGSSRASPSTRLRAREIGSTVVPLGFRRYKPRPTAMRLSQPLCTALSTSELGEVLHIRTDVAREDLPPECFSASHVPSPAWAPLPKKAMSAPPSSGLRQLRLSFVVNKRSSILSTQSSSIASSILSYHVFNSPTPQSPSASSTTSFSHSSSLSSSCEQIPDHVHHTPHRLSPVLQANHHVPSAPQSYLARHDSHLVSAPTQQPKSWRLSHYRAGSRGYTSVDGTHRFTRRASTLNLSYTTDEEQGDSTISRPVQSDYAEDWTRPASVLAAPIHAIATPKPNLLFAIASDDVDQVRQVLESGEAGPNDAVGPQSALAFTLTNNKLTHKQEIVKALLAYGANPSALQNPTLNPAPRKEGSDEPSGPPPETTLEGMDPATRYFVARADAAHTRETSRLIFRSFFRPLTRVKYDVIGQDWALEQLFRVLSMHSQKLAVAPIVVLLCGPSGHGKSLLARKFGSLLDVPTHTVNMTTLQSAHDIWQSYSMSPYEEPGSCTLAEFLIDNEGKRCVVVLDEIEKVEDQKALWSLLMPWELGRCSLGAGKRHVDARNVIWIGTSNIGHQSVFEHHQNRAEPDERMSREDYLELTAMLRPHVSHCLGPSLVSRITAVLPFVPFTLDEKKAISAEAVYTLAGDAPRTLSPQDVESLVAKALPSYQPSEGARSLHRAISNILVDMI